MNRAVRLMHLAAAVLLALLADRAATAGYYSVSYVGTGSYTQGSDGTSGASGRNASCQVSGTITATYTWVPTNDWDPAPLSAVVIEQCTAGGGGYGYQSPPSVTAADGFGDPQTGNPSGNNLYATSTGFRYSVQGGETFTTSCSPSASSSVAMGSISVSAQYSATAQPVVLNVAGTTEINVGTQQNPMIQYSVMIGQGLSTSVTTPTFSPIAWQWTLSGDPFEGFPIVNNTAGTTGPEEVSEQMYQSQGFVYYYRSIGDPGSSPPTGETKQAQTITCVETCTDPKGNAQTVTATATVYVYQPANSMTVYSIGQLSGVTHADGSEWLDANNAAVPPALPQQHRSVGIFFQASLTTPTEFAEGNGLLEFAQTSVPGYWWYPGPNGQNASDPLNGHFCIDGGVPYEGDMLPADGSAQYEGDGPGIEVYVTSSIDLTFDMYLMFVPPPAPNGAGTTMVTLSNVAWYTSGSGTYIAVNNPPWSYSAYPNLNIVGDNDTIQTSTLPTWVTTNVGP